MKAHIYNGYRKQYRIILSFLFLSFCTGFAETAVTLTVQPYAGTDFFADGKKIEPRLLQKDNTLARLRCVFKDDTVNVLEIKKDGFRPRRIDKETLFSDPNIFVILPPENSSYEVVQVFPTGRQPKSVTFVNEHAVAVPLLEGKGIDIIDIRTGETKRIAPPKRYADRLGFVETLVLKHKNELWVSQMSAACIHVFDLTSFEYKTTIQSAGGWSKVPVYNPKENRVYLSNWTTKNIGVINPDTYKEEKLIAAPAVPRGMAFDEEGKSMYCAQFEDSAGRSNCRLIKKDLHTFKTIKEMGVRGAKRHIVSDRKYLYVSDMLNAVVEVYSLKEDDRLVKTVKVFSHPNTMQLSPDGKRLYVSCRGPNNPEKGYLYKGLVMGRLDVIDTETLTVLESIEAGNQPTGLDVSPDGKTIVLSDFLDNRIRVFKYGNYTER